MRIPDDLYISKLSDANIREMCKWVTPIELEEVVLEANMDKTTGLMALFGISTERIGLSSRWMSLKPFCVSLTLVSSLKK